MAITLNSERSADEVLHCMAQDWNRLKNDVLSSTIDAGRMIRWMEEKHFEGLKFVGVVDSETAKENPIDEVSDEDLDRILDAEDDDEEEEDEEG